MKKQNLNINWFNIDGKTQDAVFTIVRDSAKKYNVNPFTLISVFLHTDELIEINFNSEIDAFKFATYCSFLKSRVDVEASIWRVLIRINQN